MLIFEKQKVCYQPICKVASSSIVVFLDMVLSGSNYKFEIHDSSEAFRIFVRDELPQRRKDIYKTCHLGGKSQEFLDNFSKNRHAYFKFSFVRHPMSRFVSAYI